ncbi:hypothetical protein B0J11DRAFT_619206 [Dendryphion nanum]|uniref:Uncharacterized protein n=1 Tax=Dendryphion nanum TaxID=256645 RepID=A0A9P9D7E5_9PLEO|nr:hypothetical protein B0J11DRAFT_619206 [Dendryphion nanum]
MAPGINLSVLAHENSTTDLSTLPTKSWISTRTTPISQIHSRGATVLDPSLITTDFDQLRFEAAAFEQLDLTHQITKSDNHTDNSIGLSTDLISSPYNSPSHYLSLTPLLLHPQALILAKSLTALAPVRPDYATAPYTDALNLPHILSLIRQFSADEGITWQRQDFFVVQFRSCLKEGIDQDWLYKLDFESHREACEGGGLLKYWFGRSDGGRRNLATCFWHTREDAHLGGTGPWHKKARAAARELYESIVFSCHRFTVLDGAEGFEFEDWKE